MKPLLSDVTKEEMEAAIQKQSWKHWSLGFMKAVAFCEREE